MTQMSSRPVQAVAPPEPKPRPETPPAAKTPEMTMPDPLLKPKTASPKADKAVDKSAAPQSDDGTEGQAGDARVEHGRGADPVRRAVHVWWAAPGV